MWTGIPFLYHGGRGLIDFKKNKMLGIAFIVPALLFYLLFMIGPVAETFGMSFFRWKGIGGSDFGFVGFRNYVRVFSDDTFWKSFERLIYFVILNVALQMALGFVLAYTISLKLKGSRFFKLVFFLPAVLSVTAVSLMWKMILSTNDGMLNLLLTAVGLASLTRSWLTDPAICFTVITLINVWLQVGMPFVILLAGIMGIPSEMYEAAAIDGADGWHRIFSITIPMMKEIIAVCMILVLSNSMKVFDVFYVITSGSFGPGNVNLVPMGYMYITSFRGNDFGRGSVMALCVMVVGAVVSVFIYFRGFNKKGGRE